MEPVLSKAARKLGIDQVAIRRVNAPEGKAPVGAAGEDGTRLHATSAFVKQALDRGAKLFDWDGRKALSRQRKGTKVRGFGVAMGCFVAGTIWFDGLIVVKPDGGVRFHCGIGNLGTESLRDVHRVAAEAMDVPWERC